MTARTRRGSGGRAAPPKTPHARVPARARPAPAPLGRGGRALVAGVLVLAWLALFWPQLAGRVFVIGDAGQFRPYAEFSHERFARTGERTFWNPYVFLGVPAVASLADARPQWLPAPALAAWDAVTGSPRGALGLVLAELLAGALALAALARALFGCGPAAMALAGLVPLLSTAVAGPLAFGHDAQTAALALTPPLLLATQRWFAAPPGAALPRGAWLALAVAALVLAGHPQFAFFGGLLALVLALSLARGEGFARRLPGFALATALGVAMSAPSWLPALLYGPDSVRSNAAQLAGDVASFSGNARDIAAMFWPRAAGFGEGAYTGGLRAADFPMHVGAVVGLCAALGLLAGRGRGAGWPWAAFALFAFAAALGARLPALQSALAAAPVLGSFRTPIVWLVPAALALALLAARGLAALEGATLPQRAGTWAIVLVAAAEMALVARPTLGRATGDAARLEAPPPYPVAVAAAADPMHRAFSRTSIEFFTNAWIAWRARTLGGLHGAAPRAWDDLRAAGLFAREPVLRALAVRYVPGLDGLLADPAHFDTLASGALALRDALPRAYAVARVEARDDESAVLAALAVPGFDAATVAYTTRGAGAGEFPGSRGAALRWLRDDPDRQEIEVKAGAPAFIVVADAWAPGWRAKVDGAPARLERVDGALRGVAAPAGTHRLELAYAPPGWTAARSLAAAAWLAWGALAALSFARRRVARGPAPAAT